MRVEFWGVRGSIAVAGPETVRTGGNTSCVRVVCGDHAVVLDGGTGLRALGDTLGFVPIHTTVLFSHVHWDHIQGVPFFGPLFHPGSKVTFAGATRDSGSLRDALDAQMRPPGFPVGLDTFRAKIDFRPVGPEPFEVGPFRVQALDLAHPDGVLAYRITAEGRSVVYATDVEHGDHLDERLVRLAHGADLLIHDAQYTPAEYAGQNGPSRRGWGHATWTDAVAVARAAGVGRLALFHHDPGRTDDQVDALETVARLDRVSVAAAREGGTVAL